MCPAATSHCQRPKPASPILADSPLSAKAFRSSVPKRLQEPARCQSPGRDFQPCVFQTTGHQVGVRAAGSSLTATYSDLSKIDTRAADRQVCRLCHATLRHTDSQTCTLADSHSGKHSHTQTHTHCQSLSGTHGFQLYTDIGWSFSTYQLCSAIKVVKPELPSD